jgi:hypothetical protein
MVSCLQVIIESFEKTERTEAWEVQPRAVEDFVDAWADFDDGLAPSLLSLHLHTCLQLNPIETCYWDCYKCSSKALREKLHRVSNLYSIMCGCLSTRYAVLMIEKDTCRIWHNTWR